MNREEFEQTATPLRARIVGMVMTMSDSVDTSLADDVAQTRWRACSSINSTRWNESWSH